MTGFEFIVLALATFRLTHLIVFDTITGFLRAPFIEVEEEVWEDGIVDEIVHVKGKGVRRFIGELISCYWCTGVWSAIIVYISYYFIPTIAYPIIIILALAAVSSIIHVMINKWSI
ncbi:DUF1360 domain-containing protein [Aquibacillus salsiterrae]|uniref:DUF1360 domain-containing protein n=1 Tax=Aquibacillus salsiterrae TaxID=2950439 RepID=A0A9X3WF32_9BACI|nr:DUF1360 domain-containing protein [Aquibacillus salsiterrae]MDC3417105.1 DUF1360 domain-containing protein [Aquibacillus salsiterrae]